MQKSPDVAFNAKYVPELPDPLKQKNYRSFVAKLQFAETWICFDISLAVSQLARFCELAGSAQWAGYGISSPRFKIENRRGMKLVDLLSGYADADRVIQQIDVQLDNAVQKVADDVEVKDVENYGTLNGGG